MIITKPQVMTVSEFVASSFFYKVGQKVWVQVERSLTDPWAPGTVKEVLAGRGGDENFRVQLDEREVTVDGKKVAQGNPATAIIPVGTRVIALYREETVRALSWGRRRGRDWTRSSWLVLQWKIVSLASWCLTVARALTETLRSSR